MLRMTRDNQYATLVGHVGKTFLSRHKAEAAVNPSQLHDPYNLSLSKIPSPCEPKIGQWDPNDPALRGHWCYDTPGVVNENQVSQYGQVICICEHGNDGFKMEIFPCTDIRQIDS